MNEQQLWVINNKLTENQRRYVLPRFEKRKKSTLVTYLLWFFFGVYYFYLGKPGLNFALWFSLCLILGLLWLLVDLFRIPGMVSEYNDRLLTELIQESKVVMN
jgi:hypothetical protein